MRSLAALYRAAGAWQSRAVLMRHLRVYLRNWYTAFLPPATEPVVLLFAFGLGLGAHVSGIEIAGSETDYLSYIAPGIIAYTAFMTPFFQALFGAFIRMHYQRTWEGQLTTQVELPHVIWGEIIWAALLGSVYVAIVCLVLAVAAFAGMLTISVPALLLTVPLAFCFGLGFAAVALAFTAWLPTIDHMNLPVFLVVLPLGFASNTYFPLPVDRPWVAFLVQCNPLYHLAESNRAMLIGDGLPWTQLAVGLLEILVLIAVLLPVIRRKLRRRVLGDADC